MGQETLTFVNRSVRFARISDFHSKDSGVCNLTSSHRNKNVSTHHDIEQIGHCVDNLINDKMLTMSEINCVILSFSRKLVETIFLIFSDKMNKCLVRPTVEPSNNALLPQIFYSAAFSSFIPPLMWYQFSSVSHAACGWPVGDYVIKIRLLTDKKGKLSRKPSEQGARLCCESITYLKRWSVCWRFQLQLP